MKYENGIFIETTPVVSDTVEIYKVLLRTGLKNIIPMYKLHATICYSSAKPSSDDVPLFDVCLFKAKIISAEIWNDETLVLTLDSPDLKRKHLECMEKYQLSYDYDEYKPHMSFVYDFDGDRSLLTDTLKSITDNLSGRNITFYGCWYKEIMK